MRSHFQHRHRWVDGVFFFFDGGGVRGPAILIIHESVVVSPRHTLIDKSTVFYTVDDNVVLNESILQLTDTFCCTMIIARMSFKRKEQRPSKYNNITDKEFSDYFSYFAFLYIASKN